MTTSDILPKETTFTPGPWEGRVRGDFQHIEQVGTNENICELGGFAPDDEMAPEDQIKIRANTALIAAAPDLYAALNAVVNYEANPDFTKWNGVIDRAKSAIAKARGEDR